MGWESEKPPFHNLKFIGICSLKKNPKMYMKLTLLTWNLLV